MSVLLHLFHDVVSLYTVYTSKHQLDVFSFLLTCSIVRLLLTFTASHKNSLEMNITIVVISRWHSQDGIFTVFIGYTHLEKT